MVSLKEQERRAKQSASSATHATHATRATWDDTVVDADNDTAADNGNDADRDDDDAVALTPEQQQEAVEQINAVNLDELLVDTITVKINDRIPYKATGYDETTGEKITVIRFKPNVRDVELEASAPMYVQLKALALQREMKKLDTHTRLQRTAECVLEVWRLTEPDMTLARLVKGLGIEQIAKLFNVFFNQASRP